MRTTTKIGTAALAGFLAVLAGCAGRAEGAGVVMSSSTAVAAADVDAATASTHRSEPVGIDELSGRTYLSTAVVGRTLAGGTIISLRFGGGQLSANAGCNTMSGAYGTGGGHLTVGVISATEIGCPSALSEQDTWLTQFLATWPSWAFDGRRLTLSSGSTTIELTDRRVADPDRPLVDTTWHLTGLRDGDSESSAPPSPVVYLYLTHGVLTVWNDCVVVIGDYTAPDGELHVTAAQPNDEPACATELVGRAVDVMGQGTTVTIEADQMRLLAQDGRGLTFTAVNDVDAPVPPTPVPAGR